MQIIEWKGKKIDLDSDERLHKICTLCQVDELHFERNLKHIVGFETWIQCNPYYQKRIEIPYDIGVEIVKDSIANYGYIWGQISTLDNVMTIGLSALQIVPVKKAMIQDLEKEIRNRQSDLDYIKQKL